MKLNWISVTDRKPATALPVLVYTADHHWSAARWSFERLWFETDDAEAVPFMDEGPEAVTMWATVPSPQEAERDPDTYAAGVAAEKARCVAVIEAEYQRFTDKSGTGYDGAAREIYGHMADAVVSVLLKVRQ